MRTLESPDELADLGVALYLRYSPSPVADAKTFRQPAATTRLVDATRHGGEHPQRHRKRRIRSTG